MNGGLKRMNITTKEVVTVTNLDNIRRKCNLEKTLLLICLNSKSVVYIQFK